MANWYVSAVDYTAVTAWSAVAHVVGDIVRPTAATAGNERVYRCTTAGPAGTVPTWPLGQNSTVTEPTSTAVWTEITGQETYNWAAPFARLRIAFPWSLAGDKFFVYSGHAEDETVLGTYPFTMPTGSMANPCIIQVVTKASATIPPLGTDAVTVATASIGVSANYAGFYFSGSFVCGGILFYSNTGTSQSDTQWGQSGLCLQEFTNCGFAFQGMPCAGVFGPVVRVKPSIVRWTNTNFYSSVVGTTFSYGAGCTFLWRGGGIVSSISASAGAISYAIGVAPTSLFVAANYGGQAMFDGVDLSLMGAGKTIMALAADNDYLKITNCKLNASVTVATQPVSAGPLTDVVSSDAANSYRTERYAYAGVLTTSVAIYHTGGANDGINNLSWKMDTTAWGAGTYCSRVAPLESLETFDWSDGSAAHTVTMYLTGIAGLTNADVWIEVEYLGTAGVPISKLLSTAPANQITAGTALTTGGAWTGGLAANYSITTPSFTTQGPGMVRVVVKLAKRTTIYVDPKVTVN